MEWDQFKWAGLRDVVNSTNGLITIEKEKKLIDGKEDTWVLHYKDLQENKFRWEGTPFTRTNSEGEQEVDIELLDRSHAAGEYTKDSARMATQALVIEMDGNRKTTSKLKMLLLAKLCHMYETQQQEEFQWDRETNEFEYAPANQMTVAEQTKAKAEWLWNMADLIPAREGPLCETSLEMLCKAGEAVRLTGTGSDIWYSRHGGRSLRPQMEAAGMELSISKKHD